MLNTSPLRREPKAGSDLSSGLVDLNSPGNPWDLTCPLSIQLHLGSWMPPVLECLWGFPFASKESSPRGPTLSWKGLKRVKTLSSSLLQTEKQNHQWWLQSNAPRWLQLLKPQGRSPSSTDPVFSTLPKTRVPQNQTQPPDWCFCSQTPAPGVPGQPSAALPWQPLRRSRLGACPHAPGFPASEQGAP